MESVKERLRNLVRAAITDASARGELAAAEIPEIFLEVPPEKTFGDYATNIAMLLARQAKMAPRAVAERIVRHLPHDAWVDKVEIAGPGFINFYLCPSWLYEGLRGIIAQGEAYGRSHAGRGEKVQVEFVSANPTGPLHVGHGRGAAVGSALANLLEAAGFLVTREFYINDAGNQIDVLATSVDARYRELLGQAVVFPEEGYRGRDIVALAQAIIDRDGDRYLALPAAERLQVFKEIALKEKLAALKKDLAEFGVTFDVWFSEQTLHASGAVTETCRLLQTQGHIYEQDGALWLRSTAFGDDKDRVVIRENGLPTYLAADIAYHRDKFRRGFDRVINIWGADHHGYIPRMKAAVAALGYDPDRLEILILQMVNLYQNGELVKMSKRTGQGVTLAELVEEVGRDAARFFFIMRSTDSQLDFDLDLAKAQSNENPVYYIQYAHARIASMFRQSGDLPDMDRVDFSVLSSELELDLLRKLAAYPEEVAVAAQRREPHRIARYAHELAGTFHSFYNHCRVLGAERPLRDARLLLVRATQIVLRSALGIMGVHAPESM